MTFTNPQQAKAYQKQYWASPQGKAVRRRWLVSTAGRESTRRARTRYRFKKTYDLSLSDRATMLSIGKCAACGTTNPGRKSGWVIHHTGSKAHGTLKVYGAFCHHCNVAARQGTQEVIIQLQRLVKFLKEHAHG